MKEVLLIGLGECVGAIFRFFISRLSQGIFGFTFPYGTLIVNIIGAFLIGFLSLVIFDRVTLWGQELRALLIIGLLGGFTTFSSFSFESVELWRNGEITKTFFYIILSVVLCLVATWAEMILAKRVGS